MEIEGLVKKMKDIYTALIDFIEATDDSDAEYITLIEVLEKQEILENKDEVRLLFQLISKIADNHHRMSDFFDKLEKIFHYLIKDIPSKISYFIPNYRKYNKRILFLLLEKRFVKPDETFLIQYLQSKEVKKISLLFDQKETDLFQIYYYLYPKMREFLEEKVQKQIEEEILQKYSETISKFEEKCQKGENDSYICSLIRSDSVEEFIAYVNRNNLSLLSKIKQSIYETNSFLVDKEPTLIEYAAFFGSIQIIQYLKYSKVPLTSSLWLYTIHSNNAELIHFLEENDVKPERSYLKKPFNDVLIESIKCHHNAISNYIKDNLSNQTQTEDQNHFYDNFNDTIVESLNFLFFPNEILSVIYEPINEKGFKLSQLCFFFTTITIPSSVTNIIEDAFYKCSSLKQITIPSSVTKIGNSAFYKCSSLKQIIISSSITKIGNYTFRECISLTKIAIPSSVTEIGEYAFLGCSSLTQITIPSLVTSIGNYAFSECSSLKKITFSSSLTSIGSNAFSCCKSLEQITIPSSVASIGNDAFNGCSSLTQITIPSSVTSFGDHIFDGIKSIEIKGDIMHIPINLFSECSSLTQITIPSSVNKIGNNVFYKCSSLRQITIPSTVTSIGNKTFEGCSLLSQIAIPSSVKEIGYSAFSGCLSLTQITIPSFVTTIKDNSFYGCSSLKQISISSSLTKIGNNAFFDCISLTQITIPSSVTSIGNYAFSFCISLTEITIPSSVKSIGDYAFSECSSLKQITIPSSVTTIGNYIFYGCSSLPDETIKSIDNVKPSNNNNYNNNSMQKQVINNSKFTWKPSSNSLKNDISLMHNNNPQNNNWSNLYKNSSSQNNTYNQIRNTTNNNNSALEDKSNQNLTNEIEIVKMLDHPNVLKAVDIVYDDKATPSILYEEWSTDLKHAIQNKMFSKVQLVYSIYQIAEGMKYIHSRKIIHLNLKPKNILISKDGTIKISDFKNAEKVESENEKREIEDIFSFGEIVYFILSGREIIKSEKEVVLGSFSLLAQQLIEACFYDDLERRPTFEMICDICEQNNFNLISLTQQETEDVLKLISQYRQNSIY